MKSILRAAYRPIDNRHYSSKKTSAIMYAAGFFPILLICLYAAISVSSYFWIVLAVIIVFGFISYFVFDAFLDKLAWKFMWNRFYARETRQHTPEQEAMKAYEQNPTPENYQTLQKHLDGR